LLGSAARLKEGTMLTTDVEAIARVVVRDYGLPLRLAHVSTEPTGQCVVGFSHTWGAGADVSIPLWCDGRVSAYQVRESIKRGLQVAD
jgi:hypothetical protein